MKFLCGSPDCTCPANTYVYCVRCGSCGQGAVQRETWRLNKNKFILKKIWAAVDQKKMWR